MVVSLIAIKVKWGYRVTGKDGACNDSQLISIEIEMPQMSQIAECLLLQIMEIIETQIEELKIGEQMQQQGVDVIQMTSAAAQTFEQADVAEHFWFQVAKRIVAQVQLFEPVKAVEKSRDEGVDAVARHVQTFQRRQVAESGRRDRVNDIVVEAELFDIDQTAEIGVDQR